MTEHSPQVKAMVAANARRGAERAVADPKQLARAVRIVRLALERRVITLEDLLEPS